MTESEAELLIEAIASAHRARDPHGDIRFHPAWYDLDTSAREAAADIALAARRLEALLDPDGLSTTARAVLGRITRAP